MLWTEKIHPLVVNYNMSLPRLTVILWTALSEGPIYCSGSTKSGLSNWHHYDGCRRFSYEFEWQNDQYVTEKLLLEEYKYGMTADVC
jgi:hypothetical protein